jgi:hypothetical protein
MPKLPFVQHMFILEDVVSLAVLYERCGCSWQRNGLVSGNKYAGPEISISGPEQDQDLNFILCPQQGFSLPFSVIYTTTVSVHSPKI